MSDLTPERLTLHAYSDLFQPDRRIHAVDGHRLPVPGGLSIASVGYAALIVVLLALAARAPVLGEILGLLHPALHWAFIPAAGAVLATRLRPDGRSAIAACATRVGAGARRAHRMVIRRADATFRRHRHRARLRCRVVRGSRGG